VEKREEKQSYHTSESMNPDLAVGPLIHRCPAYKKRILCQAKRVGNGKLKYTPNGKQKHIGNGNG